ncbi:MAG: ankyrin repeat domain-containing protein [Gammaproteobacteria bacterium]|nr:ankyrin repeat domain-containing protein [Gammaproteobacteria bacterium]
MHWAHGNQESPKSAAAVVAALAGAGADPNAVDHEGQTPLHLAARWEADPGLIDALMAVGAYADLPDDAGRTVIDWAVVGDNAEVLASLRKTKLRP